EGTSTCDAEGHWGPCEGQKLPGVEKCDATADESCDGEPACTGAPRWFLGVGDAPGTGPAAQIAFGVAFDPAGDVVVAGRVAGTSNFGGVVMAASTNTDDNVFVAKLDPFGNPVWGQMFGDGAIQAAYGVAVSDAGQIAVVGRMDGTVSFGNT